MSSSVAALLRDATAALSGSSPTPRLDAELLLAHVLSWSRARLLAERDYRPAVDQLHAFNALVARRGQGEPVAYLVGHKAFYGLDLLVTPATLVPRPETELLVELALAEARRISPQPAAHTTQPSTLREAHPPLSTPHATLRIADIGTGSGAIAIALAVNLPGALVYASDLSAEALAVAARNVAQYGMAARVCLLHGDLLAPLPEPVDLIVSNPPYTILAEIEPNVRQHEPWLALDGGPDGAAIYRRLLATAPALLRPGGAILLEIGAWQGELVASLLRAALPAAAVTVHTDLAGRERVVVGRL
jgi:release factor glutamine methyltransferase